MTFTVLSPRAADQFVLLDQSVTDLGVAAASQLAMPPGWGDSLLLDAHVVVTPIATMMANPELSGVCVRIVAAGGTTNADYLGCSRWIRTSSVTLQANVDPDQVRYLRGDELVMVELDEVDTNVAPTADLFVFLRVRRLRQDAPDRGPGDRLGRIILAT